MIGAIKAEVRKTLSTKAWWVLLLIMAGLLIFTAAAVVLAVHFGMEDQGNEDMGRAMALRDASRLVYSMASAVAYAVPALAGALLVTSEFRHKTLTWTFLAEPRREVVLAAKLVVGLPLGLAYGVVAVASVVGTGAGLLGAFGHPTGLGEPGLVAMLAREALTMALWVLVGVGFGAALKNQVAAIVVLLVFTQLIEPILRMLPAMTGQNWTWLKFLPGAAGDGVVGAGFYSAMSGDPSAGMLSTPWAIVTLLAYSVTLAGIGHFVTLRRDVT